MLPLAAGVSIGVGVFWWTITLRQEIPRPAELRDNGRTWIIGGTAEPVLPAGLSPDLRGAILETLRTGRLGLSREVAALRDSGATFASRRSARADTFRLLSPSATAVPDGRPRFRWTAVDGATGYRLRLDEEGPAAPPIEVNLPPAVNEWSPTEPLVPGASYRWQVQAGSTGARAARASFRVLNENERAAWERERSMVGDSHLLRGIVAARAGLLEEAAEEFRALGRQNPRAERARLFLEQVEGTAAR